MRVLMLGDGIALTTGFAQVLRHCAEAFRARGWELAQIASLDTPPDCDSAPYATAGVRPFFPDYADNTGLGWLKHAVEQFKPDALLCVADPGQVYNWQEQADALGYLTGKPATESDAEQPAIPFVTYAPLEGAPVHPSYVSAYRRSTQAATMTRWAQRVLHEEAGIELPAIPHGVDTSVFHPLERGERARLRRLLGWEGHYVIAYVARNAARKAQDRLLKALAHLVRPPGPDGTGVVAMPDALLYLHCVPYDSHALQGWDLAGVAHWCGVTERVQFSQQKDAQRGETHVSLAQKLACADLYVHPAKVEGFGLPILEAMACGLPVIIPEDNGNMEEVTAGRAYTVPPREWDTWFNGAQLTCVEPVDLARAILHMRQQPGLARRMGETLREIAGRSTWQAMTDALGRLIQEAVYPARTYDFSTAAEGLALEPVQ